MQIEYLGPADGEYRPGACNIGRREIAKRRTFGAIGMAFTVVLGAVLVLMDVPPPVRGLIAVPLFVSLICLEEARRRFCAGFAILGIRSVRGSDATERVAAAADSAADRAAARLMVAYCGAIATAITAVFILLPI